LINFYNRIFIKNFFNLSINQLTNVFVAIIVTPFLFQNLGAGQYGYIRLALAIVSIFGIFVSYGYHLNGPKRIALFGESNKIKLQSFLNEILTLRFCLAIFASLIIFFLIYLKVFESYSTILFFSLTILISDAIYPMFYFQGKDRLSLLAYSNFLTKIIYIFLIFLLIKSPNDSKFVNFSFGLSYVLIYILFWILIYKKEKIRFLLVSYKKIYFRIKENFEFFLSSIAGHVSTHGGLVILTNFVEAKELGMFALAQKIGYLLRMAPVFFIQSLLQIFSKKNIKNKIGYEKDLKIFFYLGLFVTFLIAIVVSFFSSSIIYFLAGENILYSQNILIILSFVPFCSMFNFKNMIEILVNEKKEVLNKSTWVTSIFMIFSVTFLCYYYKGYGLAIALLLTEIASFIIHLYFLKKSKWEIIT
jgi:O-antigen/teichoic acid export membrane protein